MAETMGGGGILHLHLHLLLLVVGVGRQESLRIVVSAMKQWPENPESSSAKLHFTYTHSVCVCEGVCMGVCVCGYYLLGIKQTSNKKDNETRKQLKMEVPQQQQVKQMLGKCQTEHD